MLKTDFIFWTLPVLLIIICTDKKRRIMCFSLYNGTAYRKTVFRNNSVPISLVSHRCHQLAISQLRTAKHLWIVWRDNAKWQKTLKVKIRARNYKRCLIISKKKPQKLFALSVPYLMTGDLYRTVPPNNPCMLCGLN